VDLVFMAKKFMGRLWRRCGTFVSMNGLEYIYIYICVSLVGASMLHIRSS
jgi:hypothetical protein